MRDDERQVADDVAGIDGVAHHQIRPGGDYAPVGGNDPEAATERHLLRDDQSEPRRRDQRGQRVGAAGFALDRPEYMVQ